jgi:hypothetical protein
VIPPLSGSHGGREAVDPSGRQATLMPAAIARVAREEKGLEGLRIIRTSSLPVDEMADALKLERKPE